MNDAALQMHDPAGLSSREAADLAALAGAEIDVFTAIHYVQEQRELVTPGRRLSHTWLYAPLSGRIEMRIGRRKQIVTPKDIALIPAGEPHGAVALTKRVSVASIHMGIHLPRATRDQPLFRKRVLRISDPAGWHRQFDTVISLERRYGHMRVSAPFLRALLMSLVMHGEPLLPRRSRVDPRIARALELIQAASANPTELPHIRRQVGLGDSRFSQLFRDATGMTPRAYCNGQRMNRALLLLRDPQKPIKEIAAALNYCDVQHLGKAFKRAFGMTPGSFRRTQ